MLSTRAPRVGWRPDWAYRATDDKQQRPMTPYKIIQWEFYVCG